MAQLQNGSQTHTAMKEVVANIMTPDEMKSLKDALLADNGKAFAEALAREEARKPAKILIDDAGKLVPKDFEQLQRISMWLESLRLYGAREKGGGIRLYGVGEIMAIVAAGQRVGMDPFYALETIALINNRTCIYGRGIRGVIMASKQCEDWQETYEGFNPDGTPTDKAKVTVTLRRKGFSTPFVGSFSVSNAIQAGLWAVGATDGAKYSPWNKYPRDMLTWRAVGRAALGFSDILGGMQTAEEMRDEEEQRPDPAGDLNRKLERMGEEPNGQAGAGREVVLPSAPAKAQQENPVAEMEPAKEEQKPEPSLGGADAKPPADVDTVTGEVRNTTKPSERRARQSSFFGNRGGAQ